MPVVKNKDGTKKEFAYTPAGRKAAATARKNRNASPPKRKKNK